MPDSLPPLRYLSASDVAALMPGVEERIALARRAMIALVSDADMPPKIAVHPRPERSFAHAMPALLRGSSDDGTEDLLGLKWVASFRGNQARGLPAIHGTVILSDPTDGVPLAFLDAGPITAHRTAAVSGVAIEAWRPDTPARAARVAILGSGVQARSHLPVVAHLLPGADVALFDRHPERSRAVAELAGTLALGAVRIATSATEAMEGADVVITMVSMGGDRQSVPVDAFRSAALVVVIDYDASVPAEIAASAALFVVDEAGQFRANRATGRFEGYPDPAGIFGERLGDPRPDGRVLATHLGVGLADLVFADALLREAESRHQGTVLAR